MTKKINYKFLKEPIIWVVAIIALFFAYPVSPGDFSFCVYKFLGWENCWGCGVGKSMSCAMHGELTESLENHKLGIFILPLMISRIAITTFNGLKPLK
jgi:hypothetical protein